jgi:hypothetical protein
VQNQVANAYPGVYQGLVTTCSYPDAVSTLAQFADFDLLRAYFEEPSKRGLGVGDSERYDPETNPGGVRCLLMDYMINVFGPQPESEWGPQEPRPRLRHAFWTRPGSSANRRIPGRAG